MSRPRPSVHSLVPAGRRVGPIAAISLAALFAALATPVVLVERVLLPAGAIAAGEAAAHTVGVPRFLGRDLHGTRAGGAAAILARGEVPDARRAAVAEAARRRAPGGATGWATYLGGLFLAGLIFAAAARRSHRGRLVRTQAVSLGLVLATGLVVELGLLATPVSVLAMPVGALALAAALAVDGTAGVATALLAAVLAGSLPAFDPGVVGLLAVQGVVPVLVLGDRRGRRVVVLAGLLAAAACAAAYPLLYAVAWGRLPVAELEVPARSAWLAAAAGGALVGPIALALEPLHRALLGEGRPRRLAALDDLTHPLLVQLAERAPGSWQHSLAMADLAERAAEAIGASARLVRVGARFHDVGKALRPASYLENLAAGEVCSLDALSAREACAEVFAHVADGVRLARRARLPARVVDLVASHHGDAVVQRMWTRCLAAGNPDGATIDEFRYPGPRPQSREAAILTICDELEGAARGLRHPDPAELGELVERVTYGKLRDGQLDESGLSLSDLRAITHALVETMRHAHAGGGRRSRGRSHATPRERPRRAGPVAQAARSAQDTALAEHRMETAPTELGEIDRAHPTGETVDLDRDPRPSSGAQAASGSREPDPRDETVRRRRPATVDATPPDRREIAERAGGSPDEALRGEHGAPVERAPLRGAAAGPDDER